MSFNPRARVGRDVVALLAEQLQVLVSIHAPAWGATERGKALPDILTGFNPRARVGRDGRGPGDRHYQQRFNPRARVGRDP